VKRTIAVLALLVSLCASVPAQDKDKTGKIKIEDGQNYLVLSTKRIQTMEKELDDVGARGFRVLYAAPTAQFDMALLLTRVRQEEGAEPYRYRVLATSRNKTMEKELNEAAREGYRLLPRTIVYKQGFLTAEMVMVMERAPGSNKSYEYKLVRATKETSLHRKIDEAGTQGFVPITMVIIGEHVIVTEKETEQKAGR
jgi:hypothetical protein